MHLQLCVAIWTCILIFVAILVFQLLQPLAFFRYNSLYLKFKGYSIKSHLKKATDYNNWNVSETTKTSMLVWRTKHIIISPLKNSNKLQFILKKITFSFCYSWFLPFLFLIVDSLFHVLLLLLLFHYHHVLLFVFNSFRFLRDNICYLFITFWLLLKQSLSIIKCWQENEKYF